MNIKVFVIGGVTLLAFTACNKQKSPLGAAETAKPYPVATLSLSNVELQSVYPTVLKGQEDIDIKPRVDGYIEAVYIDEGSIVSKGQPLFKINSPSSVQSLQNAQANYNTAKLNVERMRPLAEKGIISNVNLKTYENAFASAEATLNQAKATIGWTTVTSPVNGVVGAVPYRLGSLVTSSSVLTTVANTTNVIAYFSLNEKDLIGFMRSWEGDTQAEKIKNMPPIRLLLADGSEYEETGRVQTISGVVDAVSGAINFRAAFPNTKGLLRSGISGKVIIPKTEDSVLVVPQKATYAQQNKTLVYKVQGDSVVSKVISVKSTPDGLNYVITNGLSAGDKIVTDGVSTLKNGKKIIELN
ncbi:MAG: efflux RND transporter periplasmic adaptor subunit [Breznakibacter sp.]